MVCNAETDLPNAWYNNQTYSNTLDEKTIDRFIAVTYVRYLACIGGDFGGVVPALFTDEPQFAHKATLDFSFEAKDVILPWTDDVPQTFQKAYGADILDSLPELLWELPHHARSVIRYRYHDHIAERFASAFADRCGRWCAAHGLMLTGHMMEEPMLKSQTAALGEALRSTTPERLEAFRKAGGKLIFLVGAPELENAVPSPRGRALWQASTHAAFSQNAVLESLCGVRILDIRNSDGSRTGNLLHQLRKDGDGLWLFLAHGCLPYSKDVPREQRIRITVDGAYGVRVYDTQSGDIRAADYEICGKKTVIHASLYDYDSLLLRLDAARTCPAARPEKAAPNWRTLSTDSLVAYEPDEPNAYLLNKADYALDGARGEGEAHRASALHRRLLRCS